MADYDEDIQVPFDTIDCQANQMGVPFSLDSPYLTTGENKDVPDKNIDLDFFGCNEGYLAPSVLPAGTAMLGLLRSELAVLFHESTANMIRCHRDEFADKWRSLQCMSAFDETQPTLHRGYFRPGSRSSAPERVEEYFNKPMAIYFQHNTNETRSSISSNLVGRYVYRHWLRMHRGRPPFQRHHFLAKPIEFVHRGGGFGRMAEKPLVTDLPHVLAFHGSLCDSVEAREDDIKPDNRPRRYGATQGRPDFAPCLSQGPLSYRQHGFQLGHLFRSLFMVVDNGPRDELSPYADYDMQPAPEQRERRIDWAVSRHQVLLVKTGDDGHLSAPISFQPLWDSGRALPVNRDDENFDSWEHVVRLRLDHALGFVEDSICREERALPHVRQAAEA